MRRESSRSREILHFGTVANLPTSGAATTEGKILLGRDRHVDIPLSLIFLLACFGPLSSAVVSSLVFDEFVGFEVMLWFLLATGCATAYDYRIYSPSSFRRCSTGSPLSVSY